MKLFVRKHLKFILSLVVLATCTGMLITTNEIVAKLLPDLSTVELVSFKVAQENYVYDGEEAKIHVEQVIFRNEDGKKVKKKKDAITILNYYDNVECGKASIEIEVEGYQGSIVLEDAFQIVPATVDNVSIDPTKTESVDISWEKVYGATGYLIYKSIDGGKTYELIADLSADGELFYQDTEIALNANYLYYVSAYVSHNDVIFEGSVSNTVSKSTPLAIPVITSAKNSAYNTITLKWNAVEGAIGYQLYRSTNKNGDFTLLAEFTDGTITSYMDSTCECGINYYYYLKATQLLNTEKIYGEASDISYAKTTPNKVTLNGSTTDGQTKVKLSWNKSSGAHGYQIFKSVDFSSEYELFATIESPDVLTWVEEGLEQSTVSSYKVRPYMVVKDTVLTGSFSESYEKKYTFVYSGEISSEVSSLRQYAGKVKYVWGGTTPEKGWDCSGFTQWVYKNHFGVTLTRTAAQQSNSGMSVSKTNREEWQPGDLLFYKENGRVSHVAIYLGNGEMIHALGAEYGTVIDTVDHYESWDKKTSLHCVKRYL